jgi:hypothetical protein
MFHLVLSFAVLVFVVSTNPAWALPVNVALHTNGGTASADSEGYYYELHPASLAIDGNYNTDWCNSWNMPAWIQVKFDGVYQINRVAVQVNYNQQTYSISLSPDGSAWTKVVTDHVSDNIQPSPGANGGTDYDVFDINPIMAKYIKVDITASTAYYSHIFKAIVSEVEAYTEHGSIHLPGTWYDQDKLNLGAGGVGPLYVHDNIISNQVHDPGEAVSQVPQSGWISRSDMSCWMASAANIVRYIGGADPYDKWAFDQGVNGTFHNPYNGATVHGPLTFDDGGYQGWALRSAGYGVDEISAPQGQLNNWATDPIAWLTSELQQGKPVGIGFWLNFNTWHAVTVYEINETSDTGGTLIIADSDANQNGQHFWECEYTYASGTWAINYSTTGDNTNLCYVTYAATVSNGNPVVPEPGTLALLAPALLGFAGIAFRRVRK